MNKNPESKTAAEDLSNCINPKQKNKSKKDLYWDHVNEVLDSIFK